MSNSDFKNEGEGGFYRGLFYGVVLGLGLVWFLGTKEGKKIKEELLEKGQGFFTNLSEQSEEVDEDEAIPPLPPTL